MSIKQISVFLENRPGTLSELTGVLADSSIDMRALYLVETNDFGIARLIVDDVYKTTTVLKEAGYICKLTSVIAVAIPDEPGGLDKVLKVLGETGVNIEYMYAFLGGTAAGSATMVFRVTDYKTAEKALGAKKIRLVEQEEIAEL